MAILAYNELVDLVKSGVINAPIENINGASIDLTLHHIVHKERFGPSMDKVRLHKGESIKTQRIDMNETDCEHVMMPDSVLLASSAEWFNLPSTLTGLFMLKSSIARTFLGHEMAGLIDATFPGRLTLELKNNTQFHKLVIAPGLKIGQVILFPHNEVPDEFSYLKRGQYCFQDEAMPSRGAK